MNEGKATRYHRLKRRARVLANGSAVVAVVALLLSGASGGIRDTAVQVVGRAGLPAGWDQAGVAAVYAACVWGLLELLLVPVHAFQGYVLERRYALSHVDGVRWCRDHLATIGLGILLASGAAVVVSIAIRLWPATWWLVCAAAFTIATVLLTGLAPLSIIPWFNRVTPLTGHALSARLGTLAAQAGVPPLRLYACAVGGDTGRARATLVGLGPTRRVLVTDTLLADYSDGEIEAVLAHELGHHVHRDVWQLMAFEFALAVVALLSGGWVMSRFGVPLGLAGATDVAALPLLALGAGAVAMTAAPLGHALSRYHERRADRFAIRVTRDPDSFVSGLRRLGAQNLVEERPSRLVELLWHTHPPLVRRVEAALSSLDGATPRTPAAAPRGPREPHSTRPSAHRDSSQPVHRGHSAC